MVLALVLVVPVLVVPVPVLELDGTEPIVPPKTEGGEPAAETLWAAF